MSIMNDPIGWVLIAEQQKASDAERGLAAAVAGSYSSFGGRITYIGFNSYGRACRIDQDRDGVKAPKVWKTEAGAQKAANEHNANVMKYRSAGGMGEVRPVAIYRSNEEIRAAIGAAVREPSMMEAVAKFIDGMA